MPVLFANSRKDKSASSRNSRSRWPKEASISFTSQMLSLLWLQRALELSSLKLMEPLALRSLAFR
jgi:hypothetical protein